MLIARGIDEYFLLWLLCGVLFEVLRVVLLNKLAVSLSKPSLDRLPLFMVVTFSLKRAFYHLFWKFNI